MIIMGEKVWEISRAEAAKAESALIASFVDSYGEKEGRRRVNAALLLGARENEPVQKVVSLTPPEL